MKAKGFTLAEVLITITLLGIIAILGIPALLTNMQKAKAGPALMRAISILDNANSMMFVEQDMYDFSETCYGDDHAGYVTHCFVPFIQENIGAAQDNQTIIYQPFKNSVGNAITLSGGYANKNGFTYYFMPPGDAEGIFLYIDINGNSSPNEIGKDLFAAYISYEQNGKVIPAASRIDPNAPEGWVHKCDVSGVTDALTCAGSISDNGGKVIYPW